MNALKIALLGTAALAAVSVSARADDLSDLKAQIEALNARLAAVESTPAVPAGYQLLTVSESNAIIVPGIEDDKNYGSKATNIGIMPTADVPASTNIQWSGYVRAGVVLRNNRTSYSTELAGVVTPNNEVTVDPVTGDDVLAAALPTRLKSVDVVTRASLKVVGTTDTAVGEVGVRVVLLAQAEVLGGTNRSHDSAVATDGWWGWWKMTPELTLAGGVAGSLADSSNSFDNRCTCAYTQTGGAFGHDDPTQIRLTYESGPISFAVAVEDEANTATKSAIGVAGEMKWSGDSFGFDLNAGYWDSRSPNADISDSAWTVNAGANMALGDFANLGLAVGVGEDKHLAGSVDRYTKGSMFLGFSLSDSVSAEFGGAYTDYKGNSNSYTVAGGLYYTPVSQLTLGIEASYARGKNVAVEYLHNPPAAVLDLERNSSRETRADVIAVWRF